MSAAVYRLVDSDKLYVLNKPKLNHFRISKLFFPEHQVQEQEVESLQHGLALINNLPYESQKKKKKILTDDEKD